MKTVAIVGSGPSGIIAARKFLQSSHFAVTVFEQSPGLGGLWRPGGPINPEMRTNQTKFTVAFSDLSWESVDFDGTAAPIYPKAWQVYRYLDHYVKRYIPDEVFRFNTRVVSISKLWNQDGDGQPSRWRVTTKPTGSATDQSETEHIFDLLVIAPGAFSIPRKFPFQIQDGILQDSDSHVPLLHSTAYRFLSDIFFREDTLPNMPKNVVVVGGSHSGTEIASLLALQLSDARFSLQKDSFSRYVPKNVNVIHVISHELFALPGIFREDSSQTCAFQPADFMIFNRSNRPPEPPPSFTYGLWNEEKSKGTRDMCKAILSGGNDVSERRWVKGRPPIGVLGDTYPQFVNGGNITPVIGYLTALKKGSASKLLTASVRQHGERSIECYIENVVAVIDATGFDSVVPLSILSDDVKSDFGFDESCPRAPLHITSSYLCQNPALPSIAVLGFQGAHWGTFEMQARAISQRWSEDPIPEPRESQKKEARNLAAYIDSVREAIREHRTAEIPQNPLGDYIGLVEQGSRELHLDRLNLGCTHTSGPICSARFIDPGIDKAEAFKSMTDLEKVRIKVKESGLFIARAAFHGLLGEWISAQRGEDGKVQTVQLAFHPRLPTDRRYGWEYLAIETRQPDEQETRLVYRYDESLDEMTLWSVNTGDGLSAKAELYKLDFSKIDKHGKDTAVASRLRVGVSKEMESEAHVDFRFLFNGVSLENFTLETVSCGALLASQHFIRIGKGYSV